MQMTVSRRWVGAPLFLFCYLLAPVSAALAQQTTGTVQGTVTDAQGGVVPGARLELTHTATNVTLTRKTGPAGTYVFNFVSPGAYILKTSAPGFRLSLIKGIEVEVNKATPIDPKLEPGPVAEEVTVLASAEAIDTVTASVSTHVDRKLVTGLPSLNRNALEFAELAPGVDMNFTTTGGTGQVLNIEGSSASVNGNRQQRNAFYLDGTDNSGVFRNQALQFPNPDTVQDFQISTSNASAEFGKQVGGIFNLITRSGTNEFHGTAGYFFRAKSLNANDWNRNRSGRPRPDDRLKNFSATLGGPIRKDKTFFFGSFMLFRDTAAGFQNTRRFPTAAMLAGDFSGTPVQLVDPSTGLPLAGNRIPTSLLDPTALSLAKLIPSVASYGDRYVWSFERPARNQEALGKIDHHFNGSHSVQLSVYQTWGNQRLPDTGVNEVPSFGPQKNTSRQTTASLKHTWIVGSNVIVETRASTARHRADRGQTQLGTNLAAFAANNYTVSQEGVRKYLPNLLIADGFRTHQGFLSLFEQQNLGFGSTLTWIRGPHNVKVGAEIQRARIRQYNDQDQIPPESFTFNGSFSNGSGGKTVPTRDQFGFAFADFMMGRVASFTLRGVVDYDLHNWSNFFFIQDQWRVAPRLTLTPGLRYEFYVPTREKEGRLSAFIAGNRSTRFPTAPVGMAFPGDASVPDGLYRQDYNNLAPRLGVAYDATGDGKTALRGSFGVFYSFNAAQINMLTAERDPWRPSARASRAILSNPWLTSQDPVYTAPPTPFTNANIANYKWPAQFAAVGFAEGFETPYSYQWNLSVERELFRGLTVEAGYVGNRGRKLVQTIPINFARWRDDASLVNISARRPNPAFGEINIFANTVRSWYDALQVSANVRRGGFTSRLYYVLAKGTDTAGADPTNPNPQTANPLDPLGERAESRRRHTFRAFYVFDLPWLNDGAGLRAKILGGWQVSGSLRAESGPPLDLTLGQDWNFDGVGGDRPDLIGPIVYSGEENGDGSIQWLVLGANKAPFALPAGGTNHNAFGSLKRNGIWGPGDWTADLALIKNVRFSDQKALQLRAEAYNVFNHPNLDLPVLNFASADFGKILTRNGNRRIQLALKLLF